MKASDLKIINSYNNMLLAGILKLYQEEWWSVTRPEDDVKMLLANSSLYFIVTDLEEEKVYGYARLVTDFIYFGIIFDLIVPRQLRGKGIGSFLLGAIIAHPKVSQIEFLELCCGKELAPFYEKRGFKAKGGRMSLQRNIPFLIKPLRKET